MLVGLDGRDIGWDCMVLKLLRHSLVVVRYSAIFTCWTDLIHNFIRHMVVLILCFFTTGWLSCWLDHNLKGVYGTECARCILYDTSRMAVWGIVTKHSKKKGGGEMAGFFSSQSSNREEGAILISLLQNKT